MGRSYAARLLVALSFPSGDRRFHLQVPLVGSASYGSAMDEARRKALWAKAAERHKVDEDDSPKVVAQPITRWSSSSSKSDVKRARAERDRRDLAAKHRKIGESIVKIDSRDRRARAVERRPEPKTLSEVLDHELIDGACNPHKLLRSVWAAKKQSPS